MITRTYAALIYVTTADRRKKVWDLCLGDSTMRKIYDRFLQFSHLNVKFALKC